MDETPYWWTTVPPPAAAEQRPLPARVDVAVIGGGYTGLSAARRLARAGVSALVLEKETIGWGASSRNGGQVLTGLKIGASGLVRRYGRDAARALFGASIAAIEHLERLIEAESIACDYARTGHLDAAWRPSHFEALKREQELLAREFGHSVRIVPRAEQRAELESDAYHGLAVDDRSGSLNPARYARGLAAAAARAGAELRERTAVLQLSRSKGGWIVRTANGSLEARDVLVGTNGYTDAALPRLRRRVVPVGSYIIATRPLPEERAATLIPRRRVVFDTKNFLFYFRVLPDRRLLFGGRAQFTPATPASTRRAAAILRKGMAAVFPQLADAEIEHAWSGNVCFAPDLLPHAGRMDGVHYALGYAGHGVAMATWLGHAVAGAILGEAAPNPFADLPFPAIPLYAGRPWFLPLVGLYYGLLDRVG
jgi:glycine/D-amino acid oxidase-like deaminating enzyme